jgi:hypothetical protein
MHLNILEAQQNGFVTDPKPGDQVGIDDPSLFKKGPREPLERCGTRGTVSRWKVRNTNGWKHTQTQ